MLAQMRSRKFVKRVMKWTLVLVIPSFVFFYGWGGAGGPGGGRGTPGGNASSGTNGQAPGGGGNGTSWTGLPNISGTRRWPMYNTLLP